MRGLHLAEPEFLSAALRPIPGVPEELDLKQLQIRIRGHILVIEPVPRTNRLTRMSNRHAYREWNAIQGPVQKFPETHRPSKMRLGDILIHRAVGSPDRMVAVAEVCSDVQPTRDDSRWKWQVERRLLHVCVDVSSAPVLAEIDEDDARRLRVFKELPTPHGELAHRLIAAAGIPWTQR